MVLDIQAQTAYTVIIVYNDNYVKGVKMNFIRADNNNMEVQGLTAREMAKELNISLEATRARLSRGRIKPLLDEAVYPFSALESIRTMSKVGRPPKRKPE
jgi:enhancing lycopene biosynthesis protein 2